MASKSDMKGFYRQTKKNGGITKPIHSKSSLAATTTTTKKSVTPKLAAARSSNITRSPALISHGSPDLQDDDYDENEELLRQFDMNMTYGPCLGLSRLDRWERAKSFGLNPPRDVEPILRSSKVRNECLWDGMV
ncbi:DNA polymerase delta subunit 4-like [Solanum tuberosum]|uniref:Delta DNA polymerase n=1 Tax=Solanum tuberosum TaxID=4113 RepID=M1BNC4_SOLTU|nr:PREDICTED: DNA polymerase delta subunit 4-like [Solanum tuberosum]